MALFCIFSVRMHSNVIKSYENKEQLGNDQIEDQPKDNKT